MNKHPRFEFVIENTWQSFCGNSPEEVFNAIPHDFLGNAKTSRGRAQAYLRANALDDILPQMDADGIFYDAFFSILQQHIVGTWKWFDGVIGDFWRYDRKTNKIVRRKNKGMGTRKITPEHRAKLIANIQKLNEKFKSNPEAKKAANEKLHEYWQNITPEEREERFKRKQIQQRIRRERERLKKVMQNNSDKTKESDDKN